MRFSFKLLGLLCLACSGGESERAPDVVLISLDAVVPGRLGCYGGAVATPSIDGLAQDGIRFTEARSVAPISLPAHSSMLTGLIPPRHGVRVNAALGLSLEAVTVAEQLQAAGYQTAGFVGSQQLDAKYGLSQGFDSYAGVGPGLSDLPATAVVDRALAWLGARDQQRPSFLWVHLFDQEASSQDSVERLDLQIGRLLSALEANTVVVLVAGHGAGPDAHGAFIYDTSVRVPLIVRLADGVRAGERSTANVSIVDVAPTLLSAAGLELAGVDGLDLTGPIATDRGVYCENYLGYDLFGWSPLAAWVQSGWKLVQAPKSELYNLASDSAEATDVSSATPERMAAMRAQLRVVLTQSALQAAPIIAGAEQSALQAQLGEAGGGLAAKAPVYPSTLEPSALPSPHTRTRQLSALSAAKKLLARGQPDMALSRLREILTDNSRNRRAQELVGECLMELGQWQPAVKALQSAMRYRQGPWAGGWQKLGLCLDQLGNDQFALEAYLRSHAVAPLPEEVRARVLELLQSEKRAGEFPNLFNAS